MRHGATGSQVTESDLAFLRKLFNPIAEPLPGHRITLTQTLAYGDGQVNYVYARLMKRRWGAEVTEGDVSDFLHARRTMLNIEARLAAVNLRQIEISLR